MSTLLKYSSSSSFTCTPKQAVAAFYKKAKPAKRRKADAKSTSMEVLAERSSGKDAVSTKAKGDLCSTCSLRGKCIILDYAKRILSGIGKTIKVTWKAITIIGGILAKIYYAIFLSEFLKVLIPYIF